MPTFHMTASDHRHWLETEAIKLGTANQRERYDAGVLPEDELTQIARDELFKAFADVPRWSGHMKGAIARSIRHRGPHVAQLAPEDSERVGIEFEASEVGDLNEDEWERLRMIRSLADAVAEHPWVKAGGINVTLRTLTHWATCTQCGAEACRTAVKVSVQWAGRTLTREYAL